MRIDLTGTILNDAGDPVPLLLTASTGIELDDPNGDLVVEAVNTLEMGQPLRAGWETLFNRGIKSLSVSFTVSRQWSSAGQAEYMCFWEAVNQPMNCSAKITFGAGAGVLSVLPADSAEIESVRATHLGSLVTVAYRFRLSRFHIPRFKPQQP